MDIEIKSKTVEKLLDRVSEACAAWFKPRQIVREAKARAEARRTEAISDEILRKDIKNIRSGAAQINIADARLLNFSAEKNCMIRIEPTFGAEQSNSCNAELILREEAFAANDLRLRVEQLEQTLNLRSIQRMAEEFIEKAQLIDIESKPEISVDWISAWRDSASKTTDHQMQNLWANLLCGETLEPGKFSKRVIQFFAGMDTREARQIEKLGSCAIEGALLRFDGIIREEKISPNATMAKDEVLALLSLGILSQGIKGLRFTKESIKLGDNSDALILKISKDRIIVYVVDKEFIFSIDCLFISEIGQSVLSIGEFPPNPDLIVRVGNYIDIAFGVSLKKIYLVQLEPQDSTKKTRDILSQTSFSEDWQFDFRRSKSSS